MKRLFVFEYDADTKQIGKELSSAPYTKNWDPLTHYHVGMRLSWLSEDKPSVYMDRFVHHIVISRDKTEIFVVKKQN